MNASESEIALLGKNRFSEKIPFLLELIQQQTRQLSQGVSFRDVGTVQQIANGVAIVSGLPKACLDEVLVFTNGTLGLVFSLEPHHLDVILLGDDEGIFSGSLVEPTGERLQVPVGIELLGRVVNPLGDPLDGKGGIEADDMLFLERDAPRMITRARIDQPLYTGWKVIDTLLPIGRGQRQLILGDRQTGKSALALDAIINQVQHGVRCVYVAIGQKKTTVLKVIKTLKENDALDNTIIVLSSPDDPPAMRYLAPYAGSSMAEGLMMAGHEVLIVYDDLSKHANSYRELSLLMRRPPGREAYPGDIFYLHSRLLERAGRVHDQFGGGSITALPIVQTQQGDVSAYIPTNLISITDGQIILDRQMFNRGQRPAVDVGLSVSRVGGKAQTDAMRAVSGRLHLELAQYEEVAHFSRLGADVDEAVQQQISRGKRLQAILMQSVSQPRSPAEQIVLFFAAANGFFDKILLEEMSSMEKQLLDFVESDNQNLTYHLTQDGDWNAEIEAELAASLMRWSESVQVGRALEEA
jgi:F-type H+-transporting ATPase subunit alpha